MDTTRFTAEAARPRSRPHVNRGHLAAVLRSAEPVYALVAEADGQLVAWCITVSSDHHQDRARLLFLEDLFTAPAERGRGIEGR